MANERHIPVLLEETMAALAVKPGGRYVDGTLGRAGHARAVVERGGTVLGIDRDDQALAEVAAMGLDGIVAVKGEHADIKDLAIRHGWNQVDGILLDLGVSSPQLDDAERGFSFMREGPLDMRMDPSRGKSAADVVNEASADELRQIFREYGEEPQAARIANGIVRERARRAFATTTDLADFVERLVGRHGGHHPATRVFQALRMEVNDEMGQLRRALEGGMDILAPGGRFAIITFESLTDRVVKRFFAAHVGKMESLIQGGERWVGELPRAEAVSRRAITASEKEILENPRSRSAKLRAIKKEAA